MSALSAVIFDSEVLGTRPLFSVVSVSGLTSPCDLLDLPCVSTLFLSMDKRLYSLSTGALWMNDYATVICSKFYRMKLKNPAFTATRKQNLKKPGPKGLILVIPASRKRKMVPPKDLTTMICRSFIDISGVAFWDHDALPQACFIYFGLLSVYAVWAHVGL